jgi:hypothetical protein
MAAIRVFLLTYRRPLLLPRALASLRAQTFTDWVCELHNDDPDDDSPRRLLEAVGDARITLHQHATNWGSVASFNHAFAAGPEPFATILEDDNWWEPQFLATTHAALLANPAANLVWANMRLWQEHPDSTWTDTGRTVWSVPNVDAPPRLLYWPQPLQFADALHSNGAMLYRAAVAVTIPPLTPLAIIEPVRERMLPGGWLLLPQVLAHFALTLHTNRSADRINWAQSQLLIGGSYLEAVRPDVSALRALWARLRTQRPPSTNLLFQLAFAGVQTGAILRHAQLIDWLRFLKGALRHPVALFRSLRFRSDHAAVWKALCIGAAARSAEAALRPAAQNSGAPILVKSVSP